MNEGRDVSGWAVAGRFSTVEEAHMAASRLQAEGIEATVEPHGGYDQLQLVASPKGVAVLVARDHLAAAQAILSANAVELQQTQVEEEVEEKPPPDEVGKKRHMPAPRARLLAASGLALYVGYIVVLIVASTLWDTVDAARPQGATDSAIPGSIWLRPFSVMLLVVAAASVLGFARGYLWHVFRGRREADNRLWVVVVAAAIGLCVSTWAICAWIWALRHYIVIPPAGS